VTSARVAPRQRSTSARATTHQQRAGQRVAGVDRRDRVQHRLALIVRQLDIFITLGIGALCQHSLHSIPARQRQIGGSRPRLGACILEREKHPAIHRNDHDPLDILADSVGRNQRYERRLVAAARRLGQAGKARERADIRNLGFFGQHHAIGDTHARILDLPAELICDLGGLRARYNIDRRQRQDQRQRDVG
jgi:hypothetical protein